MIAGLAVATTVAALGINGLHQDWNVALNGYRELRQLYDVGFHVAAAKQALSSVPHDRGKALLSLESAASKLDLTYAVDDLDTGPQQWLDEGKRALVRAKLADAIEACKFDSSASDEGENRAMIDVHAIMGELAARVTEVRKTILTRQAAAERERHLTLVVVVSLCGVISAAVLVVGVRLYRSVMLPLDRVGRSVRRFADGRFDERINGDEDREFAALAGNFNTMADELQSLYQHLEKKVAEKSDQLVRSARLASVGYLAAGMAHEINNPLGIIAGYGERSLQLLENGLDESSLPRTRKAIQIICEETFRCKNITDRLLALARPGPADRKAVSLPAVAESVISILGGLPEYADRKLILESVSRDQLHVIASEGELKQVVLNLLINALQATPAGGEVRVVVRKVDGQIELSVVDNGKGMSSETLEQVFEPFFTEKRGNDRYGTGLGLSITRAIVDDLRGSIRAESGGVGRGSRFVVKLPAVGSEVEHAGR